MSNFLKFFLQFGLMNTLYGSLFGRPEKFGIRGLYIDDRSIIGGPHGVLLPKLADHEANKFFNHTLVPYPNYDFVFIDASDGYESTLKKIGQSCKRVIPGGYVLIRNVNRACRNGGNYITRLIDDMKRSNTFDILEFPDGDGMALIRVKENVKIHEPKMRRLHAGFWMSLGVVGGLVLAELYGRKKK